MQMKKWFLFGVVILLSGANLTAQHTLKGKLVDEDEIGFPAATIMLLSAEDSLLKSFGMTQSDGSFTLKAVPKGKFLLQSSIQGMEKLSQSVEVTGSTKEIDLGALKILPKATDLEGVEITAERVPVQMNGDTIKYDAQAFKTAPNANVEQLLKRLPGVEVDDEGNVKAQGETVQKILVDGKEFFGDDPKIASQNLPADAINYVEVFDKKSDMADFTGVDDGETSKTINLELKPDRRQGMFGDISGGYGNGDSGDHRFRAKANLNRFSEKSQLSFLGMGNNINEQAFSIQDYVNFMGGASNVMGGGGFGRGGGNSGLTPSDLGISWRGSGGTSTNGINTSAAAGINFNQDLGKKTELQSSYFYSFLNKDYRQESDRVNQIFDPFSETTRITTTLDSTDQLDKNHNHRVNLRLTHNIDSSARLIFVGSGRMNTTNALTGGFESTMEEGAVTNSNLRDVLTSGISYNAASSLTYMKRFAKRGRSLTVKGSLGGLQFQDKDTDNYSEVVTLGLGGLGVDTLDQDQNTTQSFVNYGGKATWTEPLSKKTYLDVIYDHQENLQDLDKSIYDLNREVFPVFNDTLSNRYDGIYRYDQPGLNFRYVTAKTNLTIGLAGQRTELNGTIGLGDSTLNKVFYNALPSLRYTYQIKKGRRLRFRYNSSVSAPTIEQLSPVVDNSNPLNIYVGNPDLKAEWRHTARVNYMLFDQFSFTNLFTMVTFTYTQDKINSFSTYNPVDNTQYSTYQNVDDDYNVNWFAYFGTPIRKLGVKINVNPGLIYSKSITFINGVENPTNSLTSTVDFSVENRKKELIDVRVGARVSHSLIRYAIDESGTGQNYLNNKFYGDFTLYLKKGWTLSTSLDYYYYTGGLQENQSVPLLTAYISKTFLKNDRGEFRLNGFDLLNQNTGVTRNFGANYEEDLRYNTLRRYAMLSFTYRIIRVGKERS